jgi:hypothetical protein
MRPSAAVCPTNDGPLYRTRPPPVEVKPSADAGSGSSAHRQVGPGIGTDPAGIVRDVIDRVEGVLMDNTQQTSGTDERRPLAGTDAASAPPCSGFMLRGRTWVYSATTADQADRGSTAGRVLIG